MTSSQESSRHLIVVATRWYAEKGSNDDEYCRQWGLNVGTDHTWFDTLHPEVLLLVLHGYKKNGNPRKISEAIAAAADDKKRPKNVALRKTVWFCHHSLASSTSVDGAQSAPLPTRETAEKIANVEIEHAKQAIANSFGLPEFEKVLYRSKGGLAVSQLVLALREHKGIPQPLPDAVEKAAGGRALFVERLRGIQSGLIRMRLLLEAGWEKELSEEDVSLLQFAMKACCIPDGGRFGDWIGVLEHSPSSDSDIVGALSVLKVLGGQAIAADNTPKNRAQKNSIPKGSPVPRPTAKVWTSLNSAARIFLAASRNASEAVRQDIALFARALDILLRAAETLPRAMSAPKVHG